MLDETKDDAKNMLARVLLNQYLRHEKNVPLTHFR